MHRGSDFEEYRALILRCKRPELDKLIKLTDLPRGGLKQELQLRLISYLDQEPPDAFLHSLNDLLLRQRNSAGNQPNGQLLPNQAGGNGTWSQGYGDRSILCGNQVSGTQVPSIPGVFPSQPKTLAATSAWSTWDQSAGVPNAQSSNLNCSTNPSLQNSSALFGAVSSQDQRVTTASELAAEKNLTYQLVPGPIGPLIGLAGARGSFRLPACLPGFRFRDSPFFKEIDVLLPPQIMTPNHITFATGRRSYDRSLALCFTPDQAETITYHCRRLPDDRMAFGVQVIMRFARLDPDLCAQLVDAYGMTNPRVSRTDPTPQPRLLTLSEDSLPVHLAIQVNGRLVQLPPLLPSNRPGLDGRRNPRPINITQFLRVSPGIANYIKLTWTHDYASFVYSLVGVYLMHKRSPQQLCALLQSTAFQTAETMKAELIRKLQTGRSKGTKAQSQTKPPQQTLDSNSTTTSAELAAMGKNNNDIVDDDDDDDDDLVMPNTLPVQLLCPLSKCRIEVPVRGRECRHIQCYDATTYLIINERKPSWNCPVCDRKVYYEDLIIDGLFLEVLNSKAAQDLDEAVFHDDGTWSVLAERSKSHNSPGSSDSSSDEAEPKQSTGSHQTNCLNSPLTGPTPRLTPNSAVSTQEPDSVGSSTTVSTGLSFGVVSPAGSGSSSNATPFINIPPNSPIRSGALPAAFPSGTTPFRTPHMLAPEKELDRPAQSQNITIDLTASDDEADRAHRSGSVTNRSGPILLSDEEIRHQNSLHMRSLFGNQKTVNPPPLAPPQSIPQPSLNPSHTSRKGSYPLTVSQPQQQCLNPPQTIATRITCSQSPLRTPPTTTANNSVVIPVWPPHQSSSTVPPNAGALTTPSSVGSRKRVSDTPQLSSNPAVDPPLMPDVQYTTSNGRPVASDPVADPRTKHMRHDPGPPAASAPVSSLIPNPLDSTNPSTFPEFGQPYESFNPSAQPYTPTPYNFYNHPSTLSSGNQTSGYQFRLNGSSYNPQAYHSQPHAQQPHHSQSSQIPSNYSNSPFDSAHCRRFRQGSTGSSRQTSSYGMSSISRDPSQVYPSAEDVYARYLTDPALHSRSEAQNPMIASRDSGLSESRVEQFPPPVDPLSSWLQFQGNAQHMH